MKNLEREQITEFLKIFLPKIIGFTNINKDQNNIYTCIFTTENSTDLLSSINSSIMLELNDYIEEILHENCKNYNRSIIFYESEEHANSLILRWV